MYVFTGGELVANCRHLDRVRGRQRFASTLESILGEMHPTDWQSRRYTELGFLNTVGAFVNSRPAQEATQARVHEAFALRGAIDVYRSFSPSKTFDMSASEGPIGEHLLAAVALWHLENDGEAFNKTRPARYRMALDLVLTDIVGEDWRTMHLLPGHVEEHHYVNALGPRAKKCAGVFRQALALVEPFHPSLAAAAKRRPSPAQLFKSLALDASNFPEITRVLSTESRGVSEVVRRRVLDEVVKKDGAAELLELGRLRSGGAERFTGLQLYAQALLSTRARHPSRVPLVHAISDVLEHRYGRGWFGHELEAADLPQLLAKFGEHNEALAISGDGEAVDVDDSAAAPDPEPLLAATYSTESSFIRSVRGALEAWPDVPDPFELGAHETVGQDLIVATLELEDEALLPTPVAKNSRPVLRRALHSVAGTEWRSTVIDEEIVGGLYAYSLRAEVRGSFLRSVLNRIAPKLSGLTLSPPVPWKDTGTEREFASVTGSQLYLASMNLEVEWTGGVQRSGSINAVLGDRNPHWLTTTYDPQGLRDALAAFMRVTPNNPPSAEERRNHRASETDFIRCVGDVFATHDPEINPFAADPTRPMTGLDLIITVVDREREAIGLATESGDGGTAAHSLASARRSALDEAAIRAKRLNWQGETVTQDLIDSLLAVRLSDRKRHILRGALATALDFYPGAFTLPRPLGRRSSVWQRYDEVEREHHGLPIGPDPTTLPEERFVTVAPPDVLDL